ncbi:MAG: class I SAM-dependent methyltransferase [Chloroflexi bacterium]|nr:class I SAM-dependent methyltransferase [Chloroflexota bacterium]
MSDNLNKVYQRAEYYDIVFNRDVSAHIDFCRSVFQQYTGRKLASVVDIACGPGYHAQGFARCGIPATGLDLSPAMLAFGQQQCRDQQLAVEFIGADMRTFDLPEPVDMALCVFDGVDLLTRTDDVIAHLRVVAKNLTPGGLYLIEQTHPREANAFHLPPLRWTGERDGTTVTFTWGVNHPQPDIISGLAEIRMEMNVTHRDGTTTQFHDTSLERTLVPQELRALTEYVVNDLRVVGYFGAFDLHQPLDWSANASSMITLLQKQRS